ncbi:hypothetical protein HPP92_025158 [Vanilla planifolia]|uniref:MSP domain-containing protein n=1 Tax=Vanilla planifolia TaxID=51239 RepID=A0A835PLD3_VANPL|nr:hypothetical protein HPP92_025158 [Vanilla planifolia]
MSTEELVVIEPLELQFPFEIKKQISCSLHITNKSDEYIAFKVKTTSPKKYCVRPNTGILRPQSTCDVVVTMQAQREAPPDMQCKDKFLIQSVITNQGATLKDITQEMFSKESGNTVNEVRLRVVYVSPPQPPSPVPEGSEEGSSPRHSLSENGNIASSEFTTERLAPAVEGKEEPTEGVALLSKLNEEKNKAIQQNNKLHQELLHITLHAGALKAREIQTPRWFLLHLRIDHCLAGHRSWLSCEVVAMTRSCKAAPEELKLASLFDEQIRSFHVGKLKLSFFLEGNFREANRNLPCFISSPSAEAISVFVFCCSPSCGRVFTGERLFKLLCSHGGADAQGENWIEEVKCGGSVPFLEPENCPNGWATPHGDKFMVQKKIGEVLNNPNHRVRKAIDEAISDGSNPFVWAFNLQVPSKDNFSAIIYFVTTQPFQDESLMDLFVKSDDAFRNTRLKLIANIAKGPWIVKTAVGEQAICILGRALSCKYFLGQNFLEVDVDIGASVFANAIVHLAFGYIKTLTVDLAFLIEGQSEVELPERILGAVRFSELNPDSASLYELPSQESSSSVQNSLPTRLWKSIGQGFSQLLHPGSQDISLSTSENVNGSVHSTSETSMEKW